MRIYFIAIYQIQRHLSLSRGHGVCMLASLVFKLAAVQHNLTTEANIPALPCDVK